MLSEMGGFTTFGHIFIILPFDQSPIHKKTAVNTKRNPSENSIIYKDWKISGKKGPGLSEVFGW
jgi:hypothetical protein